MMDEINPRSWRGVLGFIKFFLRNISFFGVHIGLKISKIEAVGEGQLKNSDEENTHLHDKD